MTHPITGAQASPRAAKKSLVGGAYRLASVDDYVALYACEPMRQVQLVKQGMPASDVAAIVERLAIPRERLFETLGLARATVDRKVRENKRLSSDETSRVLGVVRLIGQVQAMVQESGDPEGFDAGAWLAAWLDAPLPALGNQRPAVYMDTAEGRAMLSNLLSRVQTGAFA
jgi:putative toxin-antitoxin system antitoxin component (TIGR02293 family)